MCVAWANGCIAAGTGMDVVTSIDTLPTKNMSVQVYARESIGAVRVADESVVEIARPDSTDSGRPSTRTKLTANVHADNSDATPHKPPTRRHDTGRRLSQ